MQRVNLILTDKTFITRMKEIEEAEKDRIFCKHGYEHIIDVARLSYILYLENRLKNKDAEIIDKALIYAAAILHDIGRFSEFDKFLSHGEAGSVIARGILENGIRILLFVLIYVIRSVFFAVFLHYVSVACFSCLIGYPDRVCSHVSYETHGAPSGYVYSFIEPLCNGHGLLGGESQLV